MKSRRQCELILYYDNETFDDAKAIIQNLCETHTPLKQWAFIYHDKDNKKPHYHLMLKFRYPVLDSAIVNHYKINQNQIEMIKGKWTDALRYLTHKNAPNKHQYDESGIVSNFNVSDEILNDYNDKLVNDYIYKFANNEMSFSQLWSLLGTSDKIKYDKQIGIANKVRINNIILKGKREMLVYYVYGQSGIGKTTFAKWYAKEILKKPFFVSGSSNDVLDGYMGQPVMILDDLRDDSFKFHDLLKFLDNHTSSLVKSRYYNKAIDCEVIIITSTKLLSEMYSNVNNEDKFQLYRRINEVVVIEDDKTITAREIDLDKFRSTGTFFYKDTKYTLPNNIQDIYKALNIIQDNRQSIADIIKQSMKGAS